MAMQSRRPCALVVGVTLLAAHDGLLPVRPVDHGDRIVEDDLLDDEAAALWHPSNAIGDVVEASLYLTAERHG